MGETKTLSTKVDTDSDVYEQLDEYREGELSTSETVRALMRSGLEKEGYLETPTDDEPEPTGFAVRAFDFAQVAFQVSVVGVFAAVFSFAFASTVFPTILVFTASAAVTSILSTLTAATAARIDTSGLAVADIVLGTDDSSESESEPVEPAGGE